MRKKKKKLLSALVEGTLHLLNLAEALATTEEKMIDQILLFHPHPMCIHPGTRFVTAGNYIAYKETLFCLPKVYKVQITLILQSLWLLKTL